MNCTLKLFLFTTDCCILGHTDWIYESEEDLKISRFFFHLNYRSYRSVKNRGPNMYPKDVPDLVANQSNQTSPDNSSDALKNVWPDLEGEEKFGVKQGSNIKPDKTHKY